LPAVNGVYLLLDGGSGQPLALIDGAALTLRRTAAVSALAAGRLARPDATTLLMIGTGALAPHLIAAHASVRNYRRVLIWGRSPEKAAALVGEIDLPGVEVEVSPDLDQAVAAADVISAATLSTAPLVRGACVRPGTHVDLVGAFRPDMCEADSALLAGARLFVDTRAGALAEAGEIVQAIAAGAIGPEAIIGDLFDAPHSPDIWRRQSEDEITLFKAVGTAVSDFAAARLLWGQAGNADSGN
jgi:ornithine cyclodeaminase